VSYQDDARSTIDDLFGRLRSSPFASGSADPVPQSRPSGDGNIQPVGYIAEGAIDDMLLFADTIRPPEVVATLPALPDSAYPQGSFVFLTTDQKLYRNTDGSTWSVAVDGADIVANSITAGQIAAGAVGADEIAAGAITSSKIAVGTPRTNLLVNGDFEDWSGVSAGQYSYPSLFPGWDATHVSVTSTALLSSNAKSGKYILAVSNDAGWVANQGMHQMVPVRARRTYRLSGWAWKGAASGGTVQILAHSRDKDQNFVAFNVMVPVAHSGVTPVFGESTFTIPDGVAYLSVYCRWATPAANGEVCAFEDVTLEEMPGGVQNGSGNVVIDSSGITITNGALTLSDMFGQNVLTGAGFGASWVGFISSGFYNGNFQGGSLATIAVSETGGGTPTSNYNASLSSVLPYWVCSAKTGAVAFTRATDSTAPGGFALKWVGTGTTTIYQDIPIQPGQAYQAWAQARWSGTGSFMLWASYQFRGADHSAIGSEIEGTHLYGGTVAAYRSLRLGYESDIAPAGARYLRVRVKYNCSSGTPTVLVGSVWSEPLYRGTALSVTIDDYTMPILRGYQDGDNLSYPRFTISGHGTLQGGDNTTFGSLQMFQNSSEPSLEVSGGLFHAPAVGRIVRRTSTFAVGATNADIYAYTNTDFVGVGTSWYVYSAGDIRVNTPGLYLISASVVFSANPTGRRVVGIRRGHLAAPTTIATEDYQIMTASPVGDTNTQFSVLRQADNGDTFGLTVSQSSGGSVNCGPIVFGVARIGK
jgi:hypothetical protein